MGNWCFLIIIIVCMQRNQRCWIKDDVNFIKNNFVIWIIDCNIIIGRDRLRKRKTWHRVSRGWKTTRINQLVDISVELKYIFVWFFINFIQLIKIVSVFSGVASGEENIVSRAGWCSSNERRTVVVFFASSLSYSRFWKQLLISVQEYCLDVEKV